MVSYLHTRIYLTLFLFLLSGFVDLDGVRRCGVGPDGLSKDLSGLAGGKRRLERVGGLVI